MEGWNELLSTFPSSAVSSGLETRASAVVVGEGDLCL